VFSDATGTPQAAVIGGAVAGVVGGLGTIGGLIGLAIARQKRRAAAEEAAWQAKFENNGLPITASSGGEI
jgi:hypothetical protein